MQRPADAEARQLETNRKHLFAFMLFLGDAFLPI